MHHAHRGRHRNHADDDTTHPLRGARRFARGIFGRIADHHHRHHGGRGGARLFDHGELRYLLLHMLAEQPRHGYDLIRAIEDRMGGRYAPSPGAVYPTLTMLVDQGLLTVAEDGAKKTYTLTEEGMAFVAANQAVVRALLARIGAAEAGPRARPDGRILRAVENLMSAIRFRHSAGPMEETQITAVVAAIDAAVAEVERRG